MKKKKFIHYISFLPIILINMGKDKKESKKGPPLLTSAQSDAYKEILGVFFK